MLYDEFMTDLLSFHGVKSQSLCLLDDETRFQLDQSFAKFMFRSIGQRRVSYAYSHSSNIYINSKQTSILVEAMEEAFRIDPDLTSE